ncbi:MAG: family protein phosphatase [Pseudonocardiales bacterium]|jgi:protein phosphatase|nr:family protein phosphatase [Pseudonocardiales bacterium]
MSLTLRYAVRSDRGLVRNNNEDSVYAGPRLLAIADGMGGHAAGEVASKIVIGTLEPLDEDRPLGDLIGVMRDAVADANAALADLVESDTELEGMGTTLTAIRFAGTRIAVVHVGDSRAYLMRGGQLSQITHDDTYVQSLVDSGKLTLEEAAHHPRKSVILRAMTGADVEPDISIREARKGDRYLLCSDGLSDVVTSATLLETLSEGTPQACADRLIELALRGGGPDNVTCIVADVVDESEGDDRPVIGGAVVDPASAQEDDQADSPASRAARIGRVEPVKAVFAPARRRGRRLAVTVLAILAVLAAATGGYFWTQSQYFVGRDGTEVALFRGINAEFGPFTLYSVVQNSDLRVDDLQQAPRSQVNNGITARSRYEGQQILTRLAQQLLPLCPTGSGGPSPTTTPTAGRTSATARTTPPRATTTRKPTATARPTATSRPTATAKPTASSKSSPARSPSTQPPLTSSPATTECRP